MDKFDIELKAMVKESKINPSEALREKVNKTCKKAKRNSYFKTIGKIVAIFPIGIFTLGFIFPVIANEIPVVRGVVAYFSEQFNRSGYENLVESVN